MKPTLRACTVLSIQILALALAATGCKEDIDAGAIPDYASLDGYAEWPDPIPVTGAVPGHGNTYRIIYLNDKARSYGHVGEYPIGSVLVKEIYGLEGDTGQGDLSYLAIMRKIDPADVGDRLPLLGGWLFTDFDRLGDPELHSASCWNSCHVQAPIDGAWFDYGE